MKNFIIPPISAMSLSELGTAGLFSLGQLMKTSPEYKEYVREAIQRGRFVILDSGIGDHDPITQDELWDLTCELLPSEVIPLDTLFDAKATLANLTDFIVRLEKENLLGHIRVLGVPQGETKEEWLECYKSMLDNPHVNTIGISKLSAVKAWGFEYGQDQGIKEARHAIIHYLVEHNMLHKPLHFLGLGDPTEMKYYTTSPKLATVRHHFRSNDSCNAIWSAMNNISWKEHNFTRIRTPHDYFEREITQEQIMLSIENAAWYQNVLQTIKVQATYGYTAPFIPPMM